MRIAVIQKMGPVIKGIGPLADQMIYVRPNSPEGPFLICSGKYTIVFARGEPMWVRPLANYGPDDEFVKFEGSITFSNE